MLAFNWHTVRGNCRDSIITQAAPAATRGVQRAFTPPLLNVAKRRVTPRFMIEDTGVSKGTPGQLATWAEVT